MRILKIPNSGFCFGVKRSIDIAHRVISDPARAGPVYTYGPLIHNPQVVKQLEKEGIVPITSFKGKKPGKLIIRSHGVTPEVIKEAETKKFDVIDATCPFVKRAQNYAKELYKQGYKVIVVGEACHPEVQGIMGQIDFKGQVVKDKKSIAKIKRVKKLGIVAQTTLSPQTFAEVIANILSKGEEIRVYNTICEAVISRQQNTLKIAERVKLMIIAGGRNSANTIRLAELSREKGCKVYHIETKKELKPEWFKNVASVGVTAGASTPDWIIQEIIEKISPAKTG
jgi:small subunit ribosomal protein S1